MIHIAILKKEWGLLPKILSGEKKIESRWYKKRAIPWDKVLPGDTVYFKNSGEPVSAMAEVSYVIQFDNLTPGKVKMLLIKYGEDDGISEHELPNYFEIFKNKKYCILVFLKDAKSIPCFKINKMGFGSQAAWLITDNLQKVKIQ